MRYWIVSFLVVGFLFSSFEANAQMYKPKKKRKQFYGNQRLQQPLYKWVTGPNSRHGFQLQFGPTYMFTKIGETKIETIDNTRPINYTLNPTGNLGIFAEIGMVHITKRPRKFPQYYDWGLGFKQFGGKQTSTVEYTANNGSFEEGNGTFSNGYAYGRLGIHSVFQLNPVNFIDNGIGVNVDYNVLGGNQEYNGITIDNDDISPFFQNELVAQINYDFGFGFKPREGLFVIPGFRIPVFEVYEFRGGSPTMEWFSSKYMPAMFKLKLVWLFKKDPNRCPAVETNDADKKKNDSFRNSQ